MTDTQHNTVRIEEVSVCVQPSHLDCEPRGGKDHVHLHFELIDAAGDRYRLAVTAFNEQAKVELSEFAHNKI